MQTILDSGISATAIAAVLLNLLFNVLPPRTPPSTSGSTVAAAPALQITDTEMRILAEGGE
ncbi:hypothetical protein [Tsukamurella soli]|uniref:Uncharacterized protein n=1 Tax=Tsukamurella soli TaxID=644556 RepID=A0ABP8IZZ3_9ACTN